MTKQQIGVVGLAVMGKNLALNIESRGYSVAVFNRSYDKTEEFLKNYFGMRLLIYRLKAKCLSILDANFWKTQEIFEFTPIF